MTDLHWTKKLLFPTGMKPDVEEFILQTYAKRLRIGIGLGIIFLITSNLPDLYVSPELFWQLFAFKTVGIIGSLYFLYRIRAGGSLEYLTKVFYSMVLLGASIAGIMIYLTGGCHSHWALVSGVVIFIALSVSLLPPRIMFIFFLICFAGYMIPSLIHGFHHSLLQTYTHMFFYSGFGLLAILISTLQHNLILTTVAEISRHKQAASALKIRETELSAKNVELKAQKEKAQDMHKAQSEFLDNISHELRTPLTSILGFSSLLETSGKNLSPSQVEMVGKIQNQGEALLGLIENLMDLSSISNSSPQLQLHPVYLPLVIHQVVDSLQLEIASSGHNVTVQCRRDMPRIMADHEKLTQVFTQLLSNAVKFTPRGEGRIELGCGFEDGQVMAFVRDNGIGISEDNTEIIFQVFRQLDGSNTRKHGGVGIGLPIVKRIMDLHGATILLTSQVGKGTEFIMYFPISQEQQPVKNLENSSAAIP